MLMGGQECVFFKIFYVWLFFFWVAETCVHTLWSYFLLEKSFLVWVMELNMSIFLGVSCRKLRFPGAPSPKPLWKPVGYIGRWGLGQVEGTLDHRSWKDNISVEVRMYPGWQPGRGKHQPRCLETCFLTFKCHINGDLECQRQSHFGDLEKLTSGPVLP